MNKLTVLKWNDREGQISYYGNTDKFPERWAQYWLTRLKMKFSVQVSIIICGDLVLQMPNDLVGIFDETLGLDDEKESIPKKLLEDKIATNVTIITPGGMKVECHKSFLIGNKLSLYFFKAFTYVLVQWNTYFKSQLKAKCSKQC